MSIVQQCAETSNRRQTHIKLKAYTHATDETKRNEEKKYYICRRRAIYTYHTHEIITDFESIVRVRTEKRREHKYWE